MSTKQILGYWATEKTEILDAFLMEVRMRYNTVERAQKPISDVVQDLEHDRSTRPAEYWMALIRHFMVLRAATKACVCPFEREYSSETAPVPLIVPASAPNYSDALYTVLDILGQASLLLVSYREVCTSISCQHLQQRHQMFQMLCTLESVLREALTEGRAELDKALMLHARLTSPSPERLPHVRERHVAQRARREVR